MLCGIDEAGRGPIAGPLVMAGVILSKSIEGLADSKKLSEKKRALLYERIIEHNPYHIVSFSAQTIDTEGLSACLSMGLESIKTHLKQASRFLFDGNSTFKVSGIETMIKADDKIDEVRAASILAKVTRDRFMVEQSTHYPAYDFHLHKGYATKTHIEAIKRHGYCELHRKSVRLKALEATLFD